MGSQTGQPLQRLHPTQPSRELRYPLVRQPEPRAGVAQAEMQARRQREGLTTQGGKR